MRNSPPLRTSSTEPSAPLCAVPAMVSNSPAPTRTPGLLPRLMRLVLMRPLPVTRPWLSRKPSTVRCSGVAAVPCSVPRLIRPPASTPSPCRMPLRSMRAVAPLLTRRAPWASCSVAWLAPCSVVPTTRLFISAPRLASTVRRGGRDHHVEVPVGGKAQAAVPVPGVVEAAAGGDRPGQGAGGREQTALARGAGAGDLPARVDGLGQHQRVGGRGAEVGVESDRGGGRARGQLRHLQPAVAVETLADDLRQVVDAGRQKGVRACRRRGGPQAAVVVDEAGLARP